MRCHWGKAFLGSILLIAPTFAGTAIINPGFESPAVPAGTFTTFNNGADIGGWTGVGGQTAIVSWEFTQGGLTFPSHGGKQWLDLTGLNANSAEGVQQTVDTTPGASYDLSFWVGNVVDTGPTFGTTSTVNVFIDGTQKLSATNNEGSTALTWKEFTLSFTATGSTTIVKFLNGDSASDNSNGLDDVSLQLTGNPGGGGGSAVPLPLAAPTGIAMLAVVAVTLYVKKHRWS